VGQILTMVVDKTPYVGEPVEVGRKRPHTSSNLNKPIAVPVWSTFLNKVL